VKDALVVGLGLAGMGVTHALRGGGQSFTVVDVPLPHCGSPVAAGLMLPISGPRWVLRPHYEALLKAAKGVYGPLMTPVRVNRLLGDEHDPQLHKRQQDPVYAPYLSERQPSQHDATLDPHGRVQWLAHCLDVPAALREAREQLISEERLVQTSFSLIDVTFHKDHVDYQGRAYRWLILCTGHRAIEAPPFEWLRYRPSHGEWCELHPLDGLDNGIFERRHWLHQESTRTRFGSTYESKDLDAGVTAAGRKALIEAAKMLVNADVRIKKQYAGIRVAAIDWSPYVGTSPKQPRAALLAGLGSTGALLAPYCGQALVSHLMNDVPLPSWLNLARRERDRVRPK
jgi:glycine/D-amino acid oxidase-like deaminating enzyme